MFFFLNGKFIGITVCVSLEKIGEAGCFLGKAGGIMPRRSVTEILRIVWILPLREGKTSRDFCKCTVFSMAHIWVLMNVPGFSADFTRFDCCFCVAPSLDELVTFRKLCLLGKKAKQHVQLKLCQEFSFKIPENFYSLLNLSLCFLFVIKYQHFLEWVAKFGKVLWGM